jgi:hypothetical protein
MMRAKFYREFDGIGQNHHRVRLDIPGVRARKLEIEASLSTRCELWAKPQTIDCYAPLRDERGWYWRLAERIGGILKDA